jgi:hypothetical protein
MNSKTGVQIDLSGEIPDRQSDYQSKMLLTAIHSCVNMVIYYGASTYPNQTLGESHMSNENTAKFSSDDELTRHMNCLDPDDLKWNEIKTLCEATYGSDARWWGTLCRHSAGPLPPTRERSMYSLFRLLKCLVWACAMRYTRLAISFSRVTAQQSMNRFRTQIWGM